MRVRFDDLELDGEKRELSRAGEAITLEPKVFDLLCFLAESGGRLVTRQELLDAVWGGTIVGDAAISRAIREVRRAVGDDGEAQRVIKTVHARGFRFVAAIQVDGTDAPPATRPVAPAPAAPAVDDFIGRAAAIRQLGTMLDDVVAQGAGRAIVITGEPGIGKTFLADHFTKLAAARGLAVHTARCSEADGVPAFWPWEQLVRSIAASADPSTPGLADVAPLLGVATAASDDSTARFRMQDGVSRFIGAVARTQPIALVIDDLHLADEGSLALLKSFVARVRTSPIALVIATREPALAVSGVNEIALHGFEPGETALLFERQIGTAPEVRTAEALQQWTGGNPLFLSHLMHLTEGDGSGASRSTRVPRILRDAIEQTLEVLSPEARAALETASVAGIEFRLVVLAKAMGKTSADLLDVVGEALEHRIVRRVPKRVDSFTFVHGVLRDTLYAQVALGEVARLHAAIADALVGVYGVAHEDHAEELAHHFLRASPAGRAEEAVRYASLAGDHAVARAGYEQAISLYRAALDALALLTTDTTEQRERILMRLGSALGRAGRLAEAGAVFRDAVTRPAGAPFVRDVAALRSSFLAIVKRAPEVTTRFYDRLFEEHPDLRGLFRRNSAPAQAKMMNDTLLAIIDRLEDAPWLRASLAALGARHVDYGITEEMYPRVGASLLAALAEAAGPETWTEPVAAAWAQAYDAITAMMLEGAREHRYSAA